jgi:3-oxoacyl-[acyl-carrier-protein] synthase II
MAAPATHGVVVTGLGDVTPLGATAETSWEAVVAGKSGVDLVPALSDAELPVTIGAQVRGELGAADLDPKERRRLDRAILLALTAAEEAVADAGIDLSEFDGERGGVVIGSGIGGISTILHNHEIFLKRGHRRVSPFLIPMSLSNMPAGYVAIRYGLTGPILCPVSACASGAQALGEAARTIARGEADLLIAGGAEASLVPFVAAGFQNMQALSNRNDAPEQASRPFDRDRDGFVMGEGAGLFVLEREDLARARGARIRAKLLGYGITADASHVAAPEPRGRGAEACMRRALADAGLTPEDISYVNAHATSTPLGDRIEAGVIRRVLGGHVPVSSTKGATGHLFGAAGAVEALFCVRALETGILPPTLNLENPGEECELAHVAMTARSSDAQVAVSNSFGFGGTNTCLVLGHGDA